MGSLVENERLLNQVLALSLGLLLGNLDPFPYVVGVFTLLPNLARQGGDCLQPPRKQAGLKSGIDNI